MIRKLKLIQIDSIEHPKTTSTSLFDDLAHPISIKHFSILEFQSIDMFFYTFLLIKRRF